MGESPSNQALFEIEGLICDALQVISYKWLSRKFSVPSNIAKRLLERFATQNPQLDLEIVYAVSGWTKTDPPCYSIQLAPKSKLDGAKAALRENPSVHVYSVQRCLSKDPAQMWSADFVQAVELFNEPQDVNNCLRDNRFSAVACGHIQRCLARKTSGSVSSPGSLALPSLPPVSKHDENDSKVHVLPPTSSKRKVAASVPPAGGGRGGSISNLWDKTASKPKAPSPPSRKSEPFVPVVTVGDAEAMIQAMEADVYSDEDLEQYASSRTKRKTGRRRMIVEDDDSGNEEAEEEAGEEVVLIAEREETVLHDQKPHVAGKFSAPDNDQKPNVAAKASAPNNDQKPQVAAKPSAPYNEQKPQVAAKPSAPSNKEGDSKASIERPPGLLKPQPAPSKVPPSKGGKTTGKSGGKQQSSIMSFFKK